MNLIADRMAMIRLFAAGFALLFESWKLLNRRASIASIWRQNISVLILLFAILGLANLAEAGLVLGQSEFDTNISIAGASLTVRIGGELDAPNPDWEHDQFVFNGSFNPDGATLRVDLVDLNCGTNPYEPQLNDEFPVFVYNGGAPTTSFAVFELPVIASELQWDTSFIHSAGVLRVGAAPAVIPEPSAFVSLTLVGLAVMTPRRNFSRPLDNGI